MGVCVCVGGGSAVCRTSVRPRGVQAQLHPQCGVRLPFSQRRSEAPWLKKKKKNHFVICFLFDRQSALRTHTLFVIFSHIDYIYLFIEPFCSFKLGMLIKHVVITRRISQMFVDSFLKPPAAKVLRLCNVQFTSGDESAVCFSTKPVDDWRRREGFRGQTTRERKKKF